MFGSVSQTCAVVGGTLQLAIGAVASLPSELVGEFVLVGPRALAPLARQPGCRAHLALDLRLEDKGEARAFLESLPERCFVLPVDDAGCDFVSALGSGNWIYAPVSPPEISLRLRDKFNFFELCKSLDIPVPQTTLIGSPQSADFEELGMRLGLPLVFKPANESGSRGLVIAHTRDAFERRISNNPAYRFSRIVAQTYAFGVDAGFCALASDGEILRYAVQLPERRSIRFFRNRPILDYAARIVRETRYSGFLNIDFRLHGSGAVELLEFNARTWATMRACTWCGLNFVRTAMEAACGAAWSAAPSLESGQAPRTGLDLVGTALNGFVRGADFSADQKRLISRFALTLPHALRRRLFVAAGNGCA
jgi:hypothetical protein